MAMTIAAIYGRKMSATSTKAADQKSDEKVMLRCCFSFWCWYDFHILVFKLLSRRLLCRVLHRSPLMTIARRFSIAI